ncbi:MAG: DUF2227 family putative metal-binding protein [Candidatus Methanoperedens sp.]|nr:DUF2227 family putative metal-binding protein [Candidatus Methanoperedens sp.]
MPGYNTHRIFNYIIFIAAVLAVYYSGILHLSPVQLLVIGLGFYIGTEFVTPDLDIDSSAYKRWGRLRFLMLPYKWLFKHRQSSHNIFYGAIVRILYITAIIAALYYLIFKSLPLENILFPVHIIIFLVGIIAANALHVILDGIF